MTFAAIALLLAGYLLVMLTSPVRDCLRDGWRCVRRYPTMWRVLAGLGFANALFQFASRLALHVRGNPQFTWVRAEWQAGTADSIWLPQSQLQASFAESWRPSLEALAGLFHVPVTTFPIAVFAALGLFVNRRRTLSLLHGALSKRLGLASLLIIALALACAIAVVAKAVLYFWRPAWLSEALWLQSAQIVMLPAALFECAFGLGVQAWLLLYAYAWVRGMSFEREAMRDVAIRRLGAMAKWALIVMIAQAVCIELPLTFLIAGVGSSTSPDVLQAKITQIDTARLVLVIAIIVCGSIQAHLTLHGESLRRAWRGHWKLVRAYWWEIVWALIIAGGHLLAVYLLRDLMLRFLGKDTAPGVAWTLVWPFVNGIILAWLIAAWVCLFKRCEAHART